MPPRRKAEANVAPDAPRPWETPAPGFSGSLPQWAIFWAALRQFGPQSEGVIWHFQSPYAGGIPYAGGTVTDFWFPAAAVAVQVAPYRGQPPAATALLQRLALEGAGTTLVDIDSEDALRAPIAMLADALHGVSHAGGR